MAEKPTTDRTDSDLPAPDLLELKGLVQPERVRVSEDPRRVLILSVDGKEYRNVEPSFAFPISQKADYVSFMGTDGKEVALVAHPDKLDEESRKALKARLERIYYVPKITRVDSIVENHAVSRWNVLTDRGYASFEVVDRENIRRLGRFGYVICDADGNRYEIEDVNGLDARSRVLLESET